MWLFKPQTEVHQTTVAEKSKQCHVSDSRSNLACKQRFSFTFLLQC